MARLLPAPRIAPRCVTWLLGAVVIVLTALCQRVELALGGSL